MKAEPGKGGQRGPGREEAQGAESGRVCVCEGELPLAHMTAEAQVGESHCHPRGTGSVFVKPGVCTSPGRVLGNPSPVPEHRARAREGTRGGSHSQDQGTHRARCQSGGSLAHGAGLGSWLSPWAGRSQEEGLHVPRRPECLYLCEPSLPATLSGPSLILPSRLHLRFLPAPGCPLSTGLLA